MKTKLLFAGCAVFLSFLVYLLIPEAIPEAGRRVAALFIFSVIFWGLEIIPLYATSLLIVVLLTFLLTSPWDLLGVGKKGLQYFFIPFSSPIIMLFLGGLTLSAAAQRHHVDLYLMKKMLSGLGKRASFMLLGMLFISAFFSMWISNTAATAMMLMLAKPIFDQIEKGDPLKKGLVLAIAFGANIGGIGTPIGTPPNAIAIGILREYGIDIDFAGWMLMTIPLVFILLGIMGLTLFYFFPPSSKKITYSLKEIPLTFQGKSVLGIAILIIMLWLTNPLHHIPEELVALFGVSVFASLQLISVEDFRKLPWDLLVLMWGGLALGEAVQASGLIDVLMQTPFFMQKGTILIVSFSIAAILLTSFISNTATANLLLPIAVSIDPASRGFLSITVALACSFSFALPISSPPNALAYGTHLISVRDMLKPGAVFAAIALSIMLLGFEYVIPWALGPIL